MTEREMFLMIKKRYGKDSGNGPQHVVIPGVRSAAGFDARRTIDAVALGLWPSRGMYLSGFEIKCSRSDWLRELKNPAKAEEFCGLLDFFWVAVADDTIVQDGELPEHWGLLVARGGKLVQRTAATYLHEGTPGRSTPLPPAFSRSFLVPLMREAARQGDAPPEAIRDAVAKREAELSDSYATTVQGWREETERLRAVIREFDAAAGVQLASQHSWGATPAEVGRAVRTVLNGSRTVDEHRRALARIVEQADRIATAARAELAQES